MANEAGSGNIQGQNFLTAISQDTASSLQLVISTLQNLVLATNTLSVNITAMLVNVANSAG